MVQMIALDLDGTLLQQGQTELSPQVFEQIVRLQAKGIRFCPASRTAPCLLPRKML